MNETRKFSGENVDAKEFLDVLEHKKEELTATERKRVWGSFVCYIARVEPQGESVGGDLVLESLWVRNS